MLALYILYLPIQPTSSAHQKTIKPKLPIESPKQEQQKTNPWYSTVPKGETETLRRQPRFTDFFNRINKIANCWGSNPGSFRHVAVCGRLGVVPLR